MHDATVKFRPSCFVDLEGTVMFERSGSGNGNLDKKVPHNAVQIMALAILFSVGMAHWILFFDFGHMTFSFMDWSEKAKWLIAIKQAIETATIPFHISFAQETDRFLSLPNTLVSPQVILVLFMNPGIFFLLNTLLLYSVGFIGLVLIQRAYSLTFVSFSLLFLLFDFNGAITAHISVGHTDWGGYFLLSYFLYWILAMQEDKEADHARPFKLSFVLVLVCLQGSFQIYLSCIGFMFLLALSETKHLKECCLTALYSFMLLSFRLIPAMYTFSSIAREYVTGFSTLSSVLEGFTVINDHTVSVDTGLFGGTMGWWESDFFIDHLGLLLILCFGIFLRFARNPDLEKYRFSSFDWPLIIMTVLSMNYSLVVLSRLPIPCIVYSRVGTRLILLPLLILIVISVIRLDKLYLAKKSVKESWKALLGTVVATMLIGGSLAAHSYTWSIRKVEASSSSTIPDLGVQIVTREDLGYKVAVGISFGLSLVFLIIFLLRWYGIKGAVSNNRM